MTRGSGVYVTFDAWLLIMIVVNLVIWYNGWHRYIPQLWERVLAELVIAFFAWIVAKLISMLFFE